MWFLSRLIAIVALAVLFAGCGSKTPPSIACTQALPLEFAYMLSNSNTEVSMFTINSCTGAFSATTPATVPTGVAPGQIPAEDLVVDPLGRFVYVANIISNASDQANIAMFTINPSTGILTPTNPPTVPTGFLPQAIAMDPAGKFVYTANTDDNTVSMFTVNASTGVLTPTTPAAVATGRAPNFLAVHPSGKFLYVTNENDFTVSMYTIDPNTGVLSPTTPATVASGGDFGITIDPSGKFAYVVNNGANLVSTFTVDSTTGVLTKTGGVAVGQGPTTIAIDPTGKFAYVSNRLDNTLSLFMVNPTNGSLTPNAPATVATGSHPFRMNFDPARRFLYVVNEESAASVFSMNANGTLNSMGVTGSGAVSLAITAGK